MRILDVQPVKLDEDRKIIVVAPKAGEPVSHEWTSAAMHTLCTCYHRNEFKIGSFPRGAHGDSMAVTVTGRPDQAPKDADDLAAAVNETFAERRSNFVSLMFANQPFVVLVHLAFPANPDTLQAAMLTDGVDWARIAKDPHGVYQKHVLALRVPHAGALQKDPHERLKFIEDLKDNLTFVLAEVG